MKMMMMIFVVLAFATNLEARGKKGTYRYSTNSAVLKPVLDKELKRRNNTRNYSFTYDKSKNVSKHHGVMQFNFKPQGKNACIVKVKLTKPSTSRKKPTVSKLSSALKKSIFGGWKGACKTALKELIEVMKFTGDL